MRILFLAHRLPYPPNKGDKIRSFWELRTLSETHEVDLFCFYDDKRDKVQIANLYSYCSSCYAEPLSWVSSRARAAVSLISRRPFTTAFFYSPKMASRIEDAMQANAYDLAFVFGSSMAQYVERWPKMPRILDLVDVDSDKWAQYARRSAAPYS